MTGRHIEAAIACCSPNGTMMSEGTLRIMVSRQNCLQPQHWYRELRQTGTTSVQLIPQIERDASGKLSEGSVQPEEWGAFLCAVFDLWVREDISTIQIQLFESTLAIWRGYSPQIASNADNPCGECSVLRFCHGTCPEPPFSEGKNALCEGYRRFFTYSEPHMKAMRDLLKQRRSPMELMVMLSQAE